MQLARAFSLILFMATLSFGQTRGARPQSASDNNAEPITVEFCELLAKPEPYFGRLIRVKALFKNLISNESVLWTDCGKKNVYVSVGIKQDKLEEVGDAFAPMNSWGVEEANVIVVGKFFGPRVAKSTFNYGHMGWS